MLTPEREAQKRAALAIYQQHGLAMAHHQTGIPRSTLQRWAVAEGMDLAQLSGRTAEKTRAAVETRKATMAERRAALAARMLAEAEIEMERLRSQVTERRVSASGKLVEWTEAEPSPQDRRAIATVAAILIDKSNLLSGEATQRTESMTTEEARRRLREEFPGVTLRVVNQ